jgi:predicted PurR-regulated permease PerM
MRAVAFLAPSKDDTVLVFLGKAYSALREYFFMDLGRRLDSFALIAVLLAIIVTVYLTKDFLSTLLLSVVLVYLLKPIYAAFFRLTRHGQLSSFFALLIVFLVIIGVLLGLISVLLTEVSNLQMSGDLADIRLANLSEDLNAWMAQYIPTPLYDFIKEIGDIPSAIAAWIVPIAEEQLSSFASDLPVLFAKAIVAIFFTYYLLIDGRYIAEKAVELLPDRRRGVTRHFLRELNGIYTTLFTVYFTTSMLSGVLAAIGFVMLGIPYPIILGAVVGVFTLIPLLGPPFVIVPMALYYLLQNDIGKSIILLVFMAIALIVIPENVIRPGLALRSSRIHPIVTVLAYTAPVFVVGIMGVIIGPTLYGFLLAVYRTVVYYREI